MQPVTFPPHAEGRGRRSPPTAIPLETLFEGRRQAVEGAEVTRPPALREALLAATSDDRLIRYAYSTRQPVRQHDLLAETDLYERFARLDFEDDAAVARFAALWGPLARHDRVGFQGVHGEPVGEWRYVADRLRTLMVLHRALRRGRPEKFEDDLKGLVRRRGRDGFARYLSLRGGVRVEQKKGQSPQDAAREAIRLAVWLELHEVHVEPELAVASDARGPFLGSRWALHSLREALFLRFFLDLVGKVRFRQCPVCGLPFRLTRADRKYCSEPCGGRLRKRRWDEKDRARRRTATRGRP